MATPSRVFPLPGSGIHKILTEPEFRSAYHKKLKIFNPMIAFLYRAGLLPLFGAAHTMMVLTTRG